jgi:hypothetical protein
MANTSYVLIDKITVGAAGASSVTFSNIPQTGYTDLIVKINARVDRADNIGSTISMVFNAVTNSYTNKVISADGESATSTQTSGTDFRNFVVPAATATSNTFSNQEIYITNYSSTTENKAVSMNSVMENNATTSYMTLTGGLWSYNSAITSIVFSEPNGPSNFVQHSTFYLYGVAKLGTTPTIFPKATGGDTIMTDGTYWYHAFKSSGTFTPASALSCDVLVVAGGGGGGQDGGGGGAGGVFYATAQSIAATAQTVTIGGGGAGGSLNKGTNGSNSQFGSLTVGVGGGGGGSAANVNPGNGGSGGGGQRNASNAGGTSTQTGTGGTGYGFAGGSGLNTAPNYGAGAGGGAGAVGANGTSTAGGNGGIGLNTWSTWLSATGTGVSGYIAGGGGGAAYGGGTFGSGGSGGGAAALSASPAAAIANTGGGGGGSSSTAGGNAGSGIILVRYAV